MVSAHAMQVANCARWSSTETSVVAPQDGPAATPCRRKERNRESVFLVGKGLLEEKLTPCAKLSDRGRQSIDSKIESGLGGGALEQMSRRVFAPGKRAWYHCRSGHRRVDAGG